MTTELHWLTLTVLMTALFWVPYVLDRMAIRGVASTISSQLETGSPHSEWAQRARMAHLNAVENLAIFVPLVLTAHALGVSTPATQTAAVVYFFARLLHFVVYMAGVPALRTVAFTAGWLVQLVFA